MSFLIKDDELLEKYNEIWKKVKNSIKKEFDSENLIMEKSTQIFTITKYQRKVLSLFILSVILINSVFRAGTNYYPQVFS